MGCKGSRVRIPPSRPDFPPSSVVVRDHSCVRTPTGTPTTNPRSTATGRLILGLLAIAASGFDSGAARAVAPRLLRRLPDDATLRHLETAGLAPLLHWALGD